MKKHPVDDLFKRKLEGMQRTPSENAWLRIQEQRPVRHRPLVWGWYAAAGVAAAVMGGYLVWQNQQVAPPGRIKPQQSIAAVGPVQKDSAASPVENSNATAEQLALTEKSNNAVINQAAKGSKKVSDVPEINLAQIREERDSQAQSINTLNVQPSPVQHEPVMALNEKPSVPVNTIQPAPSNIPVAQDIKTLPDEPAVSQVNKPEPEPTRTIVVAVETGTNEAEEKPRNTRLARVFRQLKNARAGEKVDWDEVGFNPKNLVARVDDRLRHKDEKSSEKDHPKDKTKL